MEQTKIKKVNSVVHFLQTHIFLFCIIIVVFLAIIGLDFFGILKEEEEGG